MLHSAFNILRHSQVNCKMANFQRKMEILNIIPGIKIINLKGNICSGCFKQLCKRWERMEEEARGGRKRQEVKWSIKNPIRNQRRGSGTRNNGEKVQLDAHTMPYGCHGLRRCIPASVHWGHWPAWPVFPSLAAGEAWVYGWLDISICGWAGQGELGQMLSSGTSMRKTNQNSG